MLQVNPRGKHGWDRGSSGSKEDGYGRHLTEARRRRQELSEVRERAGCVSNGMGLTGTKASGRTVYGEYRSPSTKRVGTRRTTGELIVSRERVARKAGMRRGTKVERRRVDLKELWSDGFEEDKRGRKDKAGVSSKRVMRDERSEAIALSGKRPVVDRRVTLVVRELEHGLNHKEVRHTLQSIRVYHAETSQRGRKRLGEQPRRRQGDGGYYGCQVRVKGPLNGGLRTDDMMITLGTVPRGTKRARLPSAHQHAKTKAGTIGVRVMYCYSRG
jgi:hypothetical protein